MRHEQVWLEFFDDNVRGVSVYVSEWHDNTPLTHRLERIKQNGAEYVLAERWQPIESAPRDGTYILLLGDSGYTTTPYRIAVGCWIEGYRDHWLTHSNDAFTDDGPEATYWQPLPAAPRTD